MRVLFYGESPVVATGLAQVTRTIVDALQEGGHQVEIVGMNHHAIGSYDRDVYPYNIATLLDEDPHAVSTVVDRIKNSDFDILFVSTDFGRDMHVYEALAEKRKNELVVGYYAIDCDVINGATFNSLAYCDAKVTYTQHGKRVIESYRPDFDGLVNVIPLACEPDVFYPLSEEERRQARKDLFYVEDDNTFAVINVNRNQARKDLGRTLEIFHQFHQQHPNSKLYMHCKQDDIGGHLPTMARMIGMEPGREILFTDEKFHVLQGFTREYLNKVYNAADCLMSTSLGEGWGLSTTEAMAARTPVVVPNCTAFTEIVGENEERGYLVKSGAGIDHSQWLYGTTNHPHSIVHSDDFLEKLGRVYFRPYEAMAKAEEARLWTLQHTKEIIKNQWKEFFSEAEQFIQNRVKVKHEVC